MKESSSLYNKNRISRKPRGKLFSFLTLAIGLVFLSSGSPFVFAQGSGSLSFNVTVSLPPVLESLEQYRSDATTAIVPAGWTNEDTMVIQLGLSDPDAGGDTLIPQVEIRALGTAFSDVATHSLPGLVCAEGTTIAAQVTIPALAEDQYHWQAGVTDALGNFSGWTSFGANAENERDFGIETIAPLPGITSTESGSTNLSSIPIAVDFGEVVNGFAAGDLSINNGSVEVGSWNTGNNQLFTFNVNPTSTGDIIININAGICQDLAGNNNEPAAPFTITYTSDIPTVSIVITPPVGQTMIKDNDTIDVTGLATIGCTESFRLLDQGNTAIAGIDLSGVSYDQVSGAVAGSFNVSAIPAAVTEIKLELIVTDVFSQPSLDTASRSIPLSVDNDLPVVTSVVVNNDEQFTDDRDAVLNINVSDMSTMQMSIEGTGIEDVSGWINYADSSDVTLTAGDGDKLVTARFRDAAYNEITVTDTITLDTVAPVVDTLEILPPAGQTLIKDGDIITVSGLGEVGCSIARTRVIDDRNYEISDVTFNVDYDAPTGVISGSFSVEALSATSSIRLELILEDPAGNQSSAPDSQSNTLLVDIDESLNDHLNRIDTQLNDLLLRIGVSPSGDDDDDTDEEVAKSGLEQRVRELEKALNDILATDDAGTGTGPGSTGGFSAVGADGVMSGIINRHTMVKLYDSIIVKYRTASGLEPVVDVYDPANVLKRSKVVMPEAGESGVYEYLATFSGDLGIIGNFTIICSEPTRGTVDTLTVTVYEDLGEEEPVEPEEVDDVEEVTDEFSQQIDSLESLLEKINEDIDTDAEDPRAVLKELVSMYMELMNMNELIDRLTDTEGMSLEEIYLAVDEPEESKAYLRYLMNKIRELKGVLKSSQEMLESVTREPVVESWYEFR